MAYMILPLTILTPITALVIQRKHLLMTLLCLEAIILMLVNNTVFLWGTPPFFNTFLFIVILTFGACEASLGLALLVSLMRTYGSDLISPLTLSKC